MTLAESVDASKLAAIRSWLLWAAKLAPSIAPEELERMAAGLAEDLRLRDDALARMQEAVAEHDRRDPASTTAAPVVWTFDDDTQPLRKGELPMQAPLAPAWDTEAVPVVRGHPDLTDPPGESPPPRSADTAEDVCSLARITFVRNWVRSLLEVGRDYTDEQMLESAKGLLQHLAKMEGTERRRDARAPGCGGVVVPTSPHRAPHR